MPKKKAPKIGPRAKKRNQCSSITPKKLFETVYLPMNEIIASNENHSARIPNKHLCRTCLSETSEFHMVFEECIEEMLTTVADVEVRKDDELPFYICKLCKSKLESAYAFQIQCRRSDHWLRNRKESTTSSNSDCNLKDTKIATCRSNIEFNEAFEKPELENNFKITENNEQKFIGGMPSYLATNVISSNGDHDTNETEIIFSNTKVSNKNTVLIKTELEDIDFKMTENNEQKLIGEITTPWTTNEISSNGNCDIRETEIIFGNTKVSNKDAILIKTELEDTDFKMTENNEQMLIGEMTTPWTTNEISSNSNSNIKETEIVGNKQVSNKNVKAINTELEGNIGRNQTTDAHDQRLHNAGKQPSKDITIYKGRNGYVCVKPGLDSRVGKHLHCRKCRIDFKSIKGFDAHNEQIHFICQHCSKRFPDRSLLKRHTRNHKGPQSFICNICWNTFTSKYCLAIHKKSHPQALPYKCEICSKVNAIQPVESEILINSIDLFLGLCLWHSLMETQSDLPYKYKWI